MATARSMGYSDPNRFCESALQIPLVPARWQVGAVLGLFVLGAVWGRQSHAGAKLTPHQSAKQLNNTDQYSSTKTEE
jgi:hypothetical protein